MVLKAGLWLLRVLMVSAPQGLLEQVQGLRPCRRRLLGVCMCLQGYWEVHHASIATLLPSLDPHLTAMAERQEQESVPSFGEDGITAHAYYSPCIPQPMSAAPQQGATQRRRHQCTWCQIGWQDHTHIEPKSSSSSGDNGCGHLQLWG